MVDSLLDRHSNTSESNRADGNCRWTTGASTAEPSEVKEHLLNLARALVRQAAQEDDAADRARSSLRTGDDRSGRTRELRAWASQPVFDLIGEVEADRHMSVSGLIENLLACEVARLDSDGSRFGEKIET